MVAEAPCPPTPGQVNIGPAKAGAVTKKPFSDSESFAAKHKKKNCFNQNRMLPDGNNAGCQSATRGFRATRRGISIGHLTGRALSLLPETVVGAGIAIAVAVYVASIYLRLAISMVGWQPTYGGEVCTFRRILVDLPCK